MNETPAHVTCSLKTRQTLLRPAAVEPGESTVSSSGVAGSGVTGGSWMLPESSEWPSPPWRSGGGRGEAGALRGGTGVEAADVGEFCNHRAQRYGI